MNKETGNLDQDPDQGYATIGGRRYRVIALPDSCLEPTRRKAAETRYLQEQERLRREADQILFEKRKVAQEKEEGQFIDSNMELLLTRLYMNLA